FEMITEALILCGEKPAAHDVRLQELANLLGVSCRRVSARSWETELGDVPNHSLCVLASASTLSAQCQPDAKGADLLLRIQQKAAFLFVYGFNSDPLSESVAEMLSGGQICGVRQFEEENLRYQISSSDREITKEFSGLSFGPIRNRTDFGFLCGSNANGVHRLISIAGLPFWVMNDAGGCRTFLLACSDIVNIHEPIAGNLSVARYFSGLVPAAMFLKWVFGSRCWHSTQHFANLVVDDPLLKRSYGYLNYDDLVRKMDESAFATTIAFIPWNYRRTDPGVAK